MFAGENFASIYSQGMRDRRLRSGTKFAREIQLTDWSTAGNLSNRSSGVQIPRDICTRFGRYLYSTRCSWIIKKIINLYIIAAQNNKDCVCFLYKQEPENIKSQLPVFITDEHGLKEIKVLLCTNTMGS